MRRQSFFILFVIALAIIGATLKSYWIEAIVDQGQPVQSSALWNGLTWLGELVPKAHAYDAYAKTARDFRILDALRVCIGLDLVTIGICFLCAPFMLCIRYSRQNTRWFIESQANTIKKIWKICLGIIAFSLICLLLPIHVLIVGNHISFKPRIGGSGEWGNYPLFLDPFCITKDSYFMLIFSVSFILFLLCMKGAYIRYIIMHKSKQRQIFISS